MSSQRDLAEETAPRLQCDSNLVNGRETSTMILNFGNRPHFGRISKDSIFFSQIEIHLDCSRYTYRFRNLKFKIFNFTFHLYFQFSLTTQREFAVNRKKINNCWLKFFLIKSTIKSSNSKFRELSCFVLN